MPVGAGSDLVVGSIRWLKLLDAPAGQLTDAFKIRCFHCQPAGDKLNPEPLAGPFRQAFHTDLGRPTRRPLLSGQLLKLLRAESRRLAR